MWIYVYICIYTYCIHILTNVYVGGSQREDKLDVLERRCVESGMKTSDIWWYADLRRYGSVPHAGFGLGFERLIMFVTGLENIRDVIPFPRVPGHADF
jgi:asparaginyl-tRNA synthetase